MKKVLRIYLYIIQNFHRYYPNDTFNSNRWALRTTSRYNCIENILAMCNLNLINDFKGFHDLFEKSQIIHNMYQKLIKININNTVIALHTTKTQGNFYKMCIFDESITIIFNKCTKKKSIENIFKKCVKCHDQNDQLSVKKYIDDIKKSPIINWKKTFDILHKSQKKNKCRKCDSIVNFENFEIVDVINYNVMSLRTSHTRYENDHSLWVSLFCKKCKCVIDFDKYNKLQIEFDELQFELWKLLKKNNIKYLNKYVAIAIKNNIYNLSKKSKLFIIIYTHEAKNKLELLITLKLLRRQFMKKSNNLFKMTIQHLF